MFILIMAALMLATAGVMHAYVKNRQVEVAREIDQTQRRIEECQEQTKMILVKKDRKLNRHIIRNELAERGSDLCAIPPQVVEVVEPASGSGDAVAVSTP